MAAGPPVTSGYSSSAASSSGAVGGLVGPVGL